MTACEAIKLLDWGGFSASLADIWALEQEYMSIITIRTVPDIGS